MKREERNSQNLGGIIMLLNEKQKEEFRSWLMENVKNKDFNFSAYLDDLDTQYCNSGMREYELSRLDSKDGLSHLFTY